MTWGSPIIDPWILIDPSRRVYIYRFDNSMTTILFLLLSSHYHDRVHTSALPRGQDRFPHIRVRIRGHPRSIAPPLPVYKQFSRRLHDLQPIQRVPLFHIQQSHVGP